MGWCRRCGESVSRTEPACPACGYEPASIARRLAVGIVIFGGALGLLAPPVAVFSLFLGLLVFGWSLVATPAG